MWNSLPKDLVMAKGINSFKKGFDRVIEDKPISGYFHIQRHKTSESQSQKGPLGEVLGPNTLLVVL